MTKRKIMLVALSVCMVAILVAGGTLAYFIDTDSATNTFTVGNIDIELIESYIHRADGTDYETTATVVDGETKYAYPETAEGENGHHSDEQIQAAAKEYQDYLKDQIIMPGIGINKMPYVKNNSRVNDAYIRIHVKINANLDEHLMDSVICTTALQEEFDRPEDISLYGYETEGAYHVYTFYRREPLAAGEMTNWNVWNTITMDPDVDQSIIDWLKADGAIREDNTFDVEVSVDAIQADSFADYKAAFEAFDAQITAE